MLKYKVYTVVKDENLASQKMPKQYIKKGVWLLGRRRKKLRGAFLRGE